MYNKSKEIISRGRWRDGVFTVETPEEENRLKEIDAQGRMYEQRNFDKDCKNEDRELQLIKNAAAAGKTIVYTESAPLKNNSVVPIQNDVKPEKKAPVFKEDDPSEKQETKEKQEDVKTVKKGKKEKGGKEKEEKVDKDKSIAKKSAKPKESAKGEDDKSKKDKGKSKEPKKKLKKTEIEDDED